METKKCGRTKDYYRAVLERKIKRSKEQLAGLNRQLEEHDAALAIRGVFEYEKRLEHDNATKPMIWLFQTCRPEGKYLTKNIASLMEAYPDTFTLYNADEFDYVYVLERTVRDGLDNVGWLYHGEVQCDTQAKTNDDSDCKHGLVFAKNEERFTIDETHVTVACDYVNISTDVKENTVCSTWEIGSEYEGAHVYVADLCVLANRGAKAYLDALESTNGKEEEEEEEESAEQATQAQQAKAE